MFLLLESTADQVIEQNVANIDIKACSIQYISINR